MKYWVASDYHFGHKDKMMELCGRPEDYERRIRKNWSLIPSADCLVFLGDYCFGDDIHNHILLTAYHRFKKIFVKGNHDPKSYSWYMSHGWDFACDTYSMNIYGKSLIFSHRPIQTSESIINVHGHLHNKDLKELSESLHLSPGHILVKSEHDYKPQLLNRLVGQ